MMNDNSSSSNSNYNNNINENKNNDNSSNDNGTGINSNNNETLNIMDGGNINKDLSFCKKRWQFSLFFFSAWTTLHCYFMFLFLWGRGKNTLMMLIDNAHTVLNLPVPLFPSSWHYTNSTNSNTKCYINSKNTFPIHCCVKYWTNYTRALNKERGGYCAWSDTLPVPLVGWHCTPIKCPLPYIHKSVICTCIFPYTFMCVVFVSVFRSSFTFHWCPKWKCDILVKLCWIRREG